MSPWYIFDVIKSDEPVEWNKGALNHKASPGNLFDARPIKNLWLKIVIHENCVTKKFDKMFLKWNQGENYLQKNVTNKEIDNTNCDERKKLSNLSD